MTNSKGEDEMKNRLDELNLYGEIRQTKVTGHSSVNSVSTHLVSAILVTLFLCAPLGLTAILYAIRAKRMLKEGDIESAIAASKKAKKWCWIGFYAGAALILIVAVMLINFYFTQIDKSCIALVGKEKITVEEFNRVKTHRYAYLKVLNDGKNEFIYSRKFDTPDDVLESLIDIKLVLNAAKKKGILVTDEELRDKILKYSIFIKDGMFSRKNYMNFITAYNIKPEEFENDVREQMIVEKLIEQITSGIDEKDINLYMENYIETLKKDTKITRVSATLRSPAVIHQKP